MRIVRWCWMVAVVCAGAGAQTPAPMRPVGIAYDAAGDLYFADAARNQVFESSVGGVLSVVAGTGVQGFGGDGGMATAAIFDEPSGVAVGADGTLYVADTGNQRVRAISPAGVVSTFAGSGARGFAGDGGAATAASLCKPAGLALMADGGVLIADECNQRVRMVSGGVISSVVGSGVEGFAGDGGAATAAALDEPMGVAVDASGAMYVADARNHRVRVVGMDGVIGTFAGSGVRGFAGDGGSATAAELSWPVGVAVMSDGSLLVADADNQRVRVVSGGVISTVVGDGVQGVAGEGTVATGAAVNEMRGLAVSAFGAPVLADAASAVVKARLGNGGLYSAASMSPRVSSVGLVVPATVVYGSANARVTVSGSAATPVGNVALTDAGAMVTQGTLSGGTETFEVLGLGVGTHSLMASYAGDGFNPAAVSGTSSVVVTAAPVVATANAVTVAYGQGVPLMTGTSTGILAQDAGSESVAFTTSAGLLSVPGIYPIAAALVGPESGNYALTTAAGSGAVTVTQATTATTVGANAAYAGLPLTLTARVLPEFAGTPTGAVLFVDGGTTVAAGTLQGGAATGVYLAPGSGTHTVVAEYAGDGNFRGSTSAAVVATVGALPDFAVTVQGNASELVSAGSLATYTVMLMPTSVAFSSAVSVSASGLPANTAVSITPALVIPAAGGTVVTVSVPTGTLLSARRERGGVVWAWLPAGALGMVLLRRRRRLLLLGTVLLVGCGARTVEETSAASKTFTVHLTGTATSLAGTLLTHSVDLTLTVE